MADPLRLRLVQRASALDPAENLAALGEIAALAPGHSEGSDRPDLIVLPEAFARDFGPSGSDLSPYAEDLDGPFATELVRLSAAGPAWVAGMFERSPESSRPYNTLVFAGDGERAAYRKIHLYDSFGFRESDTVTAGPVEPALVDFRGVRLGLMTCYDLRFPELGRALAVGGAQLLVVPAAWVAGEKKVEHWRALLRARAIENTVWVAAVGQPGPRYTGHTVLVAPDGDVVAEAGEGAELLDVEVDRGSLDAVRRVNPSLRNRRM